MKPITDYNLSYNYCRVCGREPGAGEEPNYAPIRFWDPDDGWIIGTLCRGCFEEFGDRQPDPGDYAYVFTTGAVDEIETDEDPLDAL